MGEANSIRGEQRITLDADYVMRPSFAALQAIEDQTGLALFELAMNAASAKLRGSHVAIIVCEFIKADLRANGQAQQAEMWKWQKVGELLMECEGGWLAATKSLIIILNDAATGGYTAKGEAKPARAGGATSATPDAG